MIQSALSHARELPVAGPRTDAIDDKGAPPSDASRALMFLILQLKQALLKLNFLLIILAIFPFPSTPSAHFWPARNCSAVTSKAFQFVHCAFYSRFLSFTFMAFIQTKIERGKDLEISATPDFTPAEAGQLNQF